MTWIFLALTGALLFSLSSLLTRALLKEEISDPFAYSIFLQLIVAALFFVCLFFTGFHLPPLKPLIPYLFLMSLLYSISGWLSFKGLKTTEVSENSILWSSKSMWAMMAAIIFLHEPIDLKRIIGMFLVVTAIIIISWKGKKLKFNKGHFLILFAALLSGFAFTNDAFLLNYFEVLSYSAIAFLFPPLILLIIRPKSIFKFKLFLNKKRLFLILIISFFVFFSSIAVYSSYQQGGDASQIAPISQSSAILIVILAFIFLKERSHFFLKLIGSLLAFVGVLLLIS
jgi:drug/metabolite transporter (DMT)-like permease